MNKKEFNEIIEFFDCSVRQPLVVISNLFEKEQYEGAGIACNMLCLDAFTRKLESMIDVEKPQDTPAIDVEYEDQEDQVVETATADAVS